MSNKERTVLLLALLIASLAYFFPLWEISLWAPQYPEGLTMEIWINKIGGQVAQVNILNHYIGMKKIEAQMIPELELMPKILIGLIVFGLVAILFRRKAIARAWLVTFMILGVVGLYDFFCWGYDYGHNLSPDAPIKVGDMSYQPPLIGTKTILNITASSWPGWGGLLIFVAITLATWALFSAPAFVARRKLVPLFTSLFIACTATGPHGVETGVDHCSHCKMTITDAKFAVELQTKKGRHLKFDSLSCYLTYFKENKSDIKKTWVTDFLNPREMLDASEASFVESPQGPMGPTPIATRKGDFKNLGQKSQRIMSWSEVIKDY